jgi:hypothetical protein
MGFIATHELNTEANQMNVQFPAFRLQEYPDARAFDAQVGRWLVLREAENC